MTQFDARRNRLTAKDAKDHEGIHYRVLLRPTSCPSWSSSFLRRTFIASAVKPPLESALPTTTPALAMHVGHIILLTSQISRRALSSVHSCAPIQSTPPCGDLPGSAQTLCDET